MGINTTVIPKQINLSDVVDNETITYDVENNKLNVSVFNFISENDFININAINKKKLIAIKALNDNTDVYYDFLYPQTYNVESGNVSGDISVLYDFDNSTYQTYTVRGYSNAIATYDFNILISGSIYINADVSTNANLTIHYSSDNVNYTLLSVYEGPITVSEYLEVNNVRYIKLISHNYSGSNLNVLKLYELNAYNQKVNINSNEILKYIINNKNEYIKTSKNVNFYSIDLI